MKHPRSAFGASPSRGRTQRSGEAGSAGASEWAHFLPASQQTRHTKDH